MTGFDILALVILAGSLFAGWFRGAVKELVSLLSFGVAVILSLLALPFTGPVGRGLIDPDWIGVVAAAVFGFLLVYIGIRLVASAMSKGSREKSGFLGGADRLFGLVIGLVRGLLVLGALHLVVVAALPGDKTPRWLTDALVQPVSAASARAIQLVLPGLARGADALSPVVESSVRRGFNDDDALPQTQSPTTSPPAAPQ